MRQHLTSSGSANVCLRYFRNPQPGLSVHIGAKKVPLLWGVKESQVKKVLLRLWQRAPTRLASDI